MRKIETKVLIYPLIYYNSIPEKVGKNFKILRKINEGAFSTVLQAINTKTNLKVAIKFEPVNTNHPQVIYECKVYNYLHDDSTVIDKGIPNIYSCSTEGNYNFLAMDLLGPNLLDLFYQCSRKFSLKTVLMLMDQMIARVEYLHKRSFIHCNIRPENFCIGLDKTAHKVFLIDFGIAQTRLKRRVGRRGRDWRDRVWRDYLSIISNFRQQRSFRDDMESIGYVGLYFLRGWLPWQGLKFLNLKQKLKKIQEIMTKATIQVICQGFPQQFVTYLQEVRKMKYDEKPNYASMRAMFGNLLQKVGQKYDYRYDWVVLNEKGQSGPFELQELETIGIQQNLPL